uniref:Uncharacterized protein LOC114331119 n=1 Tax=Diabrotica virgifera virgifera TaxID=50390 RepID=A0A6P7FNM0_DIAVI
MITIRKQERTRTDSDASINLVASISNVQDDLASDGSMNILSLLSTQSSATRGPEIHADVAALLSGFLLKGIDKESRNNAIDSYSVISNCPALLPPDINPEIKSCLDANTLKLDTFLEKLQSQLAAGISAIAIPLNEQYKITKESLTEEKRKELEKKCDPAKILDACPIDDFLFGRSFPDQLKSSNEAGSTIKKKDKTPQYLRRL